MAQKMTWLAWLEAQIRRVGTAREFAERLGEHEMKVSRWRRRGYAPGPLEIERLAAVTGTPLQEILVMVWAAERAREIELFRPPMGVTGSPGAPSAKPASPTGRSRRRGKLAGLALAAMSLLAALAAPRIAPAGYPLGVGPDAVGIRLIGRWRRWGALALGAGLA